MHSEFFPALIFCNIAVVREICVICCEMAGSSHTETIVLCTSVTVPRTIATVAASLGGTFRHVHVLYPVHGGEPTQSKFFSMFSKHLARV
jgi:hypothetical protein